MPGTIIEKLWDSHIVHERPGAPTLLFIDLHLVHEVTSPQAFQGLRERGLKVRRPDLTIATADHRSEEHTSELQSLRHLVCRLLLEKKKSEAHVNVAVIVKRVIRGSGQPTDLSFTVDKPALFFFNDTATTEISTLSLHDALPISIMNLCAPGNCWCTGTSCIN